MADTPTHEALRQCRDALADIYRQASEHPMYLGDEAPDDEIEREGGDAALITDIGQQARAALAAADAALASPTGEPTVPSAAVLLAEQVLHMDMVTDRGLRARDLARKVLDNAHDIHEGECAEVLRSIASYLGAGGYNAPAVDPAVFREKIMWGIEQITATQPTHAALSVPAGGERERFEAWAKPRRINLQRWNPGDEDYAFLTAHEAWTAWQARASLPTPAALSVPALPRWHWHDLQAGAHLPACDGQIFVGVNVNGYTCTFNATDGDKCWNETPEESIEQMSGLRWWAPYVSPMDAAESIAPAALSVQAEPVAVVGSWELTRSIIHDCPALKMPQTWLQQLGATAQIVVLKGADDATAAHILAALNATPPPPAPVPAVPLTDAARGVLAERRRQIEVEGWTPEYDDQYADGVIARAAACYADPRDAAARWPWDWKWWKPGDRRRMLIKAGALLLAEIERLDRAHNITGGSNG